MRNHFPVLAALVLLGCGTPGVPDGGIWSKAPITGNGNESSPLTIEKGAIQNDRLVNSGLTLMPGAGLMGGGTIQLGEAKSLLNVKFGTTADTVAAGNDARFSALREDVDTALSQLGQMPWGSYIQNGIAPQTASFNVTGSGIVGAGLLVGQQIGVGINTDQRAGLHIRRTGWPAQISLTASDDADNGIGFRDSTDTGTVNVFVKNTNPKSHTADLHISTRDQDPAMIITNSGNVGIGTNQPASSLTVGQMLAANNVDYGLSILRHGTLAAPGTYSRSVPALRVADLSSDGPAALDDVGLVEISMGRIDVNDPNAANAIILRVRNDNRNVLIANGKGYVGIGTPTPNTDLDVSGRAHFSQGADCGPGCTPASSRAVKQHIRDLDTHDALAAFADLRPSRYEYKVQPSEPKLGFIAEDVPDLVAMNDRKSLDPMEFAALLTKVVQEQQKQIEQLTREVNGLKSTRAKSPR